MYVYLPPTFNLAAKILQSTSAETAQVFDNDCKSDLNWHRNGSLRTVIHYQRARRAREILKVAENLLEQYAKTVIKRIVQLPLQQVANIVFVIHFGLAVVSSIKKKVILLFCGGTNGHSDASTH